MIGPARSFRLVAAEYDRGRPGYPAAAIRWLLGDAPLTVADLGAGTGKLTGDLLAAGHRVLAVEPDGEMRALLAVRAPGAEVHAGSAEATGLADGSVDAVVAEAALHWFDRPRAFPEIARILRRPGYSRACGACGTRSPSSRGGTRWCCPTSPPSGERSGVRPGG